MSSVLRLTDRGLARFFLPRRHAAIPSGWCICFVHVWLQVTDCDLSFPLGRPPFSVWAVQLRLSLECLALLCLFPLLCGSPRACTSCACVSAFILCIYSRMHWSTISISELSKKALLLIVTAGSVCASWISIVDSGLCSLR